MVICVAGPIAAGKNFVCSILEERGFFCLDADLVIHQVIKEKEEEIFLQFKEEAAAAGLELKKSDGSLDRRALGELLFKNPNLLAKQESLVYPAFERRIQEMIDANKKASQAQDAGGSVQPITVGLPTANGAGGFAINATLLYKTPALLRQCKKIIYVDAPFLVRVWRSRRRDKLPLVQILRRMKAQKGLEGQYKKFASENNIEFIRVNNFLCDEGIKKWIS
ncbi:MAG: dephospho-CoA kinase [Treponema sp.]|nr:dephospho-CoA kinase [Treponema sp.]